MIDLLVSRFLYVLCWRNKVVIILIILSASLGMLITLSYHSNKHPSTADEVLRSGKGHIPLEHHFKNLVPPTDHRRGAGDQPGGHQGLEDAQGVQRKFLEKDVGQGIKRLRNSAENESPGEREQLQPPGRGRADIQDLGMGVQGPKRSRITAPEGRRSYQHVVESPVKKQTGSSYQKPPSKHLNENVHVGVLRQENLKGKNVENEIVVLPPKVAVASQSYHGDSISTRKWKGQNDVGLKPVGNGLAGDVVYQKVNRTQNRFGLKSSYQSQTVQNQRRRDYKENSLRPLNKLPGRNVGQVIDPKKDVEGVPPNRGRSNDASLLFKPRETRIGRDKTVKDEINGKIRQLPQQNKQMEKSSYLNQSPQTLTQTDSQKNYRNQPLWGQQRQAVAVMDNSVKSKLTGEKMMGHHKKDDFGLKHSKAIIRKGIGKFYPLFDKPITPTDLQKSMKWQQNQGISKNAPLSGKILHEIDHKLKQIPLNIAELPVSPKPKNLLKDRLLNDRPRRPKPLQKMNSLEQIGQYLPEVRERVLNRSRSRKVNRTEPFNLWDSINKPKDTGVAVGSQVNISSMMLALARQRRPAEVFVPHHRSTSYRPAGAWPEVLAQWTETEERYCDGHFTVMNNEFAFLKDVIVDRNFCHGRNGGEEIHEVINQAEDEEYYTYFPGFFQLPCQVKPQYFFNNNNHLNQWLYSLNSVRDESLYSEMRHEFTIAVVRYEYANLYHTTTDFYNAFLLMEYYNKTQTDTNILIVDGHPKGALDPVWDVLFNSSRRINKQSTRTKYSQLVWSILGYNSPIMDHYAPNIPLVEEFRTFFLSSYRIADNRKLDCDKINILFIWRRDYVAHPRNPSGSISRKIQNEQELVVSLRQNFPSFSVKGIQIDLFEMNQQLKFITQTDILIGMHGAGLTHAMYLPKHAGMIELLPTYWSAANEHFHAIARWRHLHYRQWVNADPQNEAPNHFTKIPPEVLNDMVTDMVKVVCGLATDPPDTFFDTR